MSLLDKLADKACNTKGAMRYPALILSGVADWVAGTYDEARKHDNSLADDENEHAQPSDYRLCRAVKGTCAVGEGFAFKYAMMYRLTVPTYLLGADLVVRDLNLFGSLIMRAKDAEEGARRSINLTGLIGSARTLGYKLADRLRRDESEAEPEAEIEAEPDPEPAADTETL